MAEKICINFDRDNQAEYPIISVECDDADMNAGGKSYWLIRAAAKVIADDYQVDEHMVADIILRQTLSALERMTIREILEELYKTEEDNNGDE